MFKPVWRTKKYQEKSERKNRNKTKVAFTPSKQLRPFFFLVSVTICKFFYDFGYWSCVVFSTYFKGRIYYLHLLLVSKKKHLRIRYGGKVYANSETQHPRYLKTPQQVQLPDPWDQFLFGNSKLTVTAISLWPFWQGMVEKWDLDQVPWDSQYACNWHEDIYL